MGLLSNPRLGIRTKFFLLIVPVTAFFVVLFTVLVVDLSNEQRQEQNKRLAQSIGRRDARLLAPVLWNIDFDGQRRILDVIASEERLRCIRLYEENLGAGRGHTDGNGGGERADSTAAGEPIEIASAGSCSDVEQAYRVETPIVHRVGAAEHRVGLAIHWIDISRDAEDVRKEILGFSQLSLMMYVVLGFCISIGFRRVVLGPIRAMEVSLQKYVATGVRDKVDWSSQDELGDFIQAYNESVDRQNHAEKEMKSAREAAEAALTELRLAKDSLVQSEKLASLGSLVAGIAHEINTPIGSSLTVATALEERTRRFRDTLASGALKKSVLEEYVEGVGEASAILGLSLQAAGEQIQKFKQVAVDQTSTQRRAFNLAVVTEEVLSTLRPRIKRTQIELKVDMEPDLVMDSYPGPIGQLLSNLFTNALIHGFQDSGKGVITIEARRVDPDRVELLFADNGVGMNAEQKRHLYDPFYTTRMGCGGSGLGMHIVYNLVTTVLGGRISVDSAPGEGTRIIINMPLSPAVALPSIPSKGRTA